MMKLADRVEQVRQLIDNAFRNRLGRMGITASALQPIESVPVDFLQDRKCIEIIRKTLIAETGSITDAYEKLVEEFTFTLFNRLAALKVMEAHTLHPEILTRRTQHGERSFSHFLWLEQNPAGRSEEMEGLVPFLEEQLTALASEIPLFSPHHPYHLLPTAIELNGIVNAVNQMETDTQVDTEIWKSEDVLGWLYESYNNYKKKAHKDSGNKTEYNKVSVQSQVYTPRWVVKFLVDNSLGKLYLEMFPDSTIKDKYKIANAPMTQTRDRKPLTEIRLIDPATGSGNFLLYGFDLFYDFYTDQIENYGAEYDESKISELIIHNNLYGIDLDDRAIQLTQLALYIKAKRKKRSSKIEHFNIVSSDFFLPDYQVVKHLFENGEKLSSGLEEIVTELWEDLQQAFKFGSLIMLEEKFTNKLFKLESKLEKPQVSMFEYAEMETYTKFRHSFFESLKKALIHNTEKQGITFLNTKTTDAITFLQVLTQKYDVAATNPPYTDSSDFGPELKKFVDANYKQPYKFNSNLYTTFIKRCYELTNDIGYVAIIQPHTFMFIKSFEDVRKYIIEHTHIDLLVDYGLDRVNLFGTGILLNAAWYVLSKKNKDEVGIYFNIIANQQEKYKRASFEKAFDNVLGNQKNERVYNLAQSKLKIIEGWPFIYWISDGFREKFKEINFGKVFTISGGLKTAKNIKYLRNHLEINLKNSTFKPIFKGGAFNKWYGNIWLALDYLAQKKNIEKESSSGFSGEKNYFNEGIVCPSVGTKGPSFRYKPLNVMFSNADFGIFYKNSGRKKYYYPIAILNSTFVRYINEMLNPTVNIEAGDIKRIPFVKTTKENTQLISILSSRNIEIKQKICTYHIIETSFIESPFTAFIEASIKDRLLTYLNYENAELALVLLNEAIINKLIFEVYNLSLEDQEQVETKMGKSIGELSVLAVAQEAYLLKATIENEFVRKFIQNLPTIIFEEQQIQSIKADFAILYQSNNDLEEFCISHQLNPINVWYWFRESKALPQARAAEMALEFLTDACRTILMEDDDGIIPLVGLPGESRLLDRLEQNCLHHGFTSAQFMQLEGLLGRPINEYMEHYFFKNLSDHLNLFPNLPKTPFIWHLTSGPKQGFEAFIIIYKWNRDSLYKLKTKYLSKRTENLEYRQILLAESDTAQTQNEKEMIRLQLQEIKEFAQKIDELIAEGYDPKLDDGVGKNIAPLQLKGMLQSEVLNTKQLDKYLKADW